MKKTYQPKHKEVRRDWHEVDAEGQVLGRLSSDIAKFLMGKHKATYSPHMDMGDYVVVKNAKKVVLTGKKEKQKKYIRHSGYPGGLKEVTFEKLFSEQPKKVIEFAVSGMLPKNRLHSKRMRRLKVVEGDKHEFEKKIK